MSVENDFLPVATSNGATVMSQANFLASTMLTTGVNIGEADPTLANKCWRQSAAISNVFTTLINNILNVSTIDDGTTSTLISNYGTTLRLATFVADTSTTVNVAAATIPNPPLALVDGMIVDLKIKNTNTGGVSFNFSGLGVYPIVTSVGALTGGELMAGFTYKLVWLAATNQWFLNYQSTAVTQITTDTSNKIATDAFVHNAVSAATTSLIPSGTRMLFAQGSAPTGWTQDTSDTANNRMMRVVQDASGNGVGGSFDPTYMNVVAPHSHTFSTSYENAAHNHAIGDPGHAHSYLTRTSELVQSGGATTCWHGDQYVSTGASATGVYTGTESANHAHTGSTDNGSSSTVYYPRYINIIICQKV